MAISAESLWNLPEVALLATYHDVRRRYVESKFARDTESARLDWLKAKAFTNSAGGVSERRNAIEASEEFGRKGQQVREMTRDLELLKADVDLIAMIVHLRGIPGGGNSKAGSAHESDEIERGLER